MSEGFDKAFWDDHYHDHALDHGDGPNPQLLAEAGDLAPGRALDAGCGEGADAVWLALRGWRVTAVDIAAAALEQGRRRAERLGPDVAGRIVWLEADLTTWAPAEGAFDLVTSHYVHTAAPFDDLVRRLAGAVAPGGTLLVVGHDPSDRQHAAAESAYITGEQVTAVLDSDRWEIVVVETRSRPGGHGGHGQPLLDAVLHARRRPG